MSRADPAPLASRVRASATRIGIGLGLIGIFLALLGVGSSVVDRPQLALLAAMLVLAMGVSVAEPVALPLLAFPLVAVVMRVGVEGPVSLSLSDAALAIATIPALVFAQRPFSRELRILLWLSAAYQFATLFSVAANPYAANVVEWVHAWMLISGALLVGWAVGRRGLAKVALGMLLATIALLAVGAITQGVASFARGDFGPVYPAWPFGMHKNFIGNVSAVGAVIAYARPPWLGWPKWLSASCFWLLTAALLFSQSRQAILGLVASILVLVLRSGQERRRSRLILLVAAPAVLFVSNLIQDEVQSGNRFNAVFQRVTWLQDSFRIWATDPWVGVGQRWWNSDRFGVRFQPPNAEVEVLTSSGIIGLVAFLALAVGSLMVIRRIDKTYGTLALAILLGRLVQSQVDLYWTSVTSSLPFLITGVCLGAVAAAQAKASVDPMPALNPARASPGRPAVSRPDGGSTTPC